MRGTRDGIESPQFLEESGPCDGGIGFIARVCICGAKVESSRQAAERGSGDD